MGQRHSTAFGVNGRQDWIASPSQESENVRSSHVWIRQLFCNEQLHSWAMLRNIKLAMLLHAVEQRLITNKTVRDGATSDYEMFSLLYFAKEWEDRK